MPAQCSRCWLSIDCSHQFVQLFIVNPPLFHRGWLTGNINNWVGKKSRLVELTNLLRQAAQHVCCKAQSLSILYSIHQFVSGDFHNGRHSFESTFCHNKHNFVGLHHCFAFKFAHHLFDLPGHHAEAWVELYICYWTLQNVFINMYMANIPILSIYLSFTPIWVIPDVLLWELLHSCHPQSSIDVTARLCCLTPQTESLGWSWLQLEGPEMLQLDFANQEA